MVQFLEILGALVFAFMVAYGVYNFIRDFNIKKEK